MDMLRRENKTMTKAPTFDQMMNPVLQALKSLGGSGTIIEIDSKVAEILDLSDQQLEIPHNSDSRFSRRNGWPSG